MIERSDAYSAFICLNVCNMQLKHITGDNIYAEYDAAE